MAPISFPVGGITDGVVRLRPMSDADIPEVAAACQDAEIQRYTTVPSPYGLRDARDWMRAGQAGMAAGSELHALIVPEHGADAQPADGSHGLIGSVGIAGLDPLTRRCQAGYWVAPWARGRGAAARAVRLICDYAFAELEVARIELWVEPQNVASRQVAERSGFRAEGVMRSFMPVGGRRRDMIMYARLAPEPGRAS